MSRLANHLLVNARLTLTAGQALCFPVLVLLIGRLLNLALGDWTFSLSVPLDPQGNQVLHCISGGSLQERVVILFFSTRRNLLCIVAVLLPQEVFLPLFWKQKTFAGRNRALISVTRNRVFYPSPRCHDAEIFCFYRSFHNGDNRVCCPLPRCVNLSPFMMILGRYH